MSDLISRNDVLHELDWCDYGLKDWQKWKLKMMVRDIPSAEPERRWIPCSERLPVAYVEVLVCQLYGDVPFIAYVDSKRRWCTEGFFISEDYEPIAWMPLPKAARVEE